MKNLIKRIIKEELAKLQETKFIAYYNDDKHEIEAKDLWDAKKKAIKQLRIPKSKVGLLSVVSVDSQEKGDFRFY